MVNELPRARPVTATHAVEHRHGQRRIPPRAGTRIFATLNDDRPNVFLTDPRVSERERQDTRVSGLGPVLTYDSRDVQLAAFRGNLLDVSATFNGTGLGSDYRFVRYQLDARHFQPIVSNRTILALQFLGQVHTGDVPVALPPGRDLGAERGHCGKDAHLGDASTEGS